MLISLQAAINFCEVVEESMAIINDNGEILYQNSLANQMLAPISLNSRLTLACPNAINWADYYQFQQKRNGQAMHRIPVLNAKEEFYYMNANIFKLIQCGYYLVKIQSVECRKHYFSEKEKTFHNIMHLYDEYFYPVLLTDLRGNVIAYNLHFEEMFNIKHNEIKSLEQLFERLHYDNQMMLDYYKNIGNSNIGRLKGKIVANGKDISIYSFLNEEKEVLISSFSDESHQRKDSHAAKVIAVSTAKILHEINNPLTTLKGYIQLFEKNSTFDQSYISVFHKELSKIESLATDLLYLSSPRKEVFNPINIIPTIEHCIQLMSIQANDLGCQIVFSCGCEDDIVILGNERQLIQIFTNLMKNSLEAMENSDNEKIMIVCLKKEHDQVVIEVQDNGEGIAIEQLSQIFQAFHTTKEKGTGLGLSVTKEIVESHRGTISVASTIGVGTTFTLKFPLIRQLKNEPHYHDQTKVTISRFDKTKDLFV